MGVAHSRRRLTQDGPRLCFRGIDYSQVLIGLGRVLFGREMARCVSDMVASRWYFSLLNTDWDAEILPTQDVPTSSLARSTMTAKGPFPKIAFRARRRLEIAHQICRGRRGSLPIWQSLHLPPSLSLPLPPPLSSSFLYTLKIHTRVIYCRAGTQHTPVYAKH